MTACCGRAAWRKARPLGVRGVTEAWAYASRAYLVNLPPSQLFARAMRCIDCLRNPQDHRSRSLCLPPVLVTSDGLLSSCCDDVGSFATEVLVGFGSSRFCPPPFGVRMTATDGSATPRNTRLIQAMCIL